MDGAQVGQAFLADLLSDTVTVPCSGMRDAMRDAPVGDDVYREDPTVAALERYAADLLGKEAALFVLSGTMGNLIAACVHTAGHAFPEVILGTASHVAREEVGGISAVARSATRQLPVDSHGAMDLAALEVVLAEEPDVHCTSPCALFLEDTHGMLGGTCLPKGYATSVRALCQAAQWRGALHLDGARLWNAAAARGETPAEAVRPFDSVSCCLSKGLGAPMGSVLAGTAAFVDHARKARKMLGGSTRQAGVVAAAGLFALKRNLDAIPADHARALEFAAALTRCAAPDNVLVDVPQTNIVLFQLRPGAAAMRKAVVDASLAEGVRVGMWYNGKIRAVMHRSLPANAHVTAAQVIARNIKAIVR
jgi:threonine aldolase